MREVCHDRTQTWINVFDFIWIGSGGDMVKKIDLKNFEGTADQVAEQIFKQLIAPMLDEMKSQDPDSAKLFAFSILWLGLASYASQFVAPDGAKKSINFTIDKFMSAFDEFNKRPS